MEPQIPSYDLSLHLNSHSSEQIYHFHPYWPKNKSCIYLSTTISFYRIISPHHIMINHAYIPYHACWSLTKNLCLPLPTNSRGTWWRERKICFSSHAPLLQGHRKRIIRGVPWVYPNKLGVYGKIPLKWMIRALGDTPILGNLHVVPSCSMCSLCKCGCFVDKCLAFGRDPFLGIHWEGVINGDHVSLDKGILKRRIPGLYRAKSWAQTSNLDWIAEAKRLINTLI